MSGFLVINPRSGRGQDAEEVRTAAEGLGVETHLLKQGEDPTELARTAPDGPLGVAGGDGSLAQVAAVALERDLPFVVIPSGTFNHFARDAGLDRDDPVGALQSFSGRETRVDVARVNDRLFLNNVSLGLYARLVHEQEQAERFPRLRALGMLLRSPRGLGVTVDGRPAHARVLVVSNNAYKLDVLELGERDRLDEGHLQLSIAHGWLPSTWEQTSATELTVDSRAGRLEAAVDGEPETLETPLRFRIEPRALRLLLPERG
ncbi:MAG TPA: diacylglycerol kinase family protein [Gaiellaceae bacterium]